MKITVFTHRHGISFDVVHDNVDCEEHWKEKDGYLGRNEDGMVIDDYEDVWEFSMPEPFNSAPDLLAVLQQIVEDTNEFLDVSSDADTFADRMRANCEDAERAIAKAGGAK